MHRLNFYMQGFTPPLEKKKKKLNKQNPTSSAHYMQLKPLIQKFWFELSKAPMGFRTNPS